MKFVDEQGNLNISLLWGFIIICESYSSSFLYFTYLHCPLRSLYPSYKLTRLNHHRRIYKSFRCFTCLQTSSSNHTTYVLLEYVLLEHVILEHVLLEDVFLEHILSLSTSPNFPEALSNIQIP